MADNQIKLTCVIVKYKNPELCEKLVDSLSDGTLEIVLSDNHAQDISDKLREKKACYVYIDNKANVGFGKAANTGAKCANTDWLLFLNPDVDISAENANLLVMRAIEASFDSCCPSTQDPRYNEPLPSFWWFLARFTPLKRIPIFSLLANKKSLTLWGGCLLIKKTVFDKLGGFDERFFLWFEDSDITKRLIDRGYKVGRVEVPGIKHIGGISFESMSDKEKRKIFFTSATIYADIHGNIWEKALARLLKLRYSIW